MQCPKKQPIKLQGNNKLEKKKYISRVTRNDRPGTYIKLLISHHTKTVATFLSNIFEDQIMKFDVRILQVLGIKFYSRVLHAYSVM